MSVMMVQKEIPRQTWLFGGGDGDGGGCCIFSCTDILADNAQTI